MLYKECWKGNTTICTILGVKDIKEEKEKKIFFKQIEPMYDQCDKKDIISCYALGVYYLNDNFKKDADEAEKYYKKACDYGCSSCCERIGFIYEDGVQVKQDIKKAEEYYKKACDKDNVRCYSLVKMYINMQNQEAVKYYKQFCNSNHLHIFNRHCEAVFDNMYDEKTDSFIFQTDEIEKLKNECDMGNNTSCGDLGKIYFYGVNILKDKNKAKELCEKGCKAGVDMCCRIVADMYLTGIDGIGLKRDVSKALEYYEALCDKNSFVSCLIIGDIYEGGKYLKQDSLKAEEYFKKSCTKESAGYCHNLIRFYKNNNESKKAKDYYDKVCENVKGDEFPKNFSCKRMKEIIDGN